MSDSFIFIKEEKRDEFESNYINDSFVFIKEEKKDETDFSSSPMGMNEEEKPQTYYDGLIHVKPEELHLLNDDSTIGSRKEKESSVYHAKQEKVLKSQCRELVLKVQQFFEAEKLNDGPFIRVHEALKRTAAATQVSARTIRRICIEKYGENGSEEHALKTPGKKRPRLCPRTTMDLFHEEATRQHIYEYYQRNEYPTIARLLETLKEANIYSGSRTSLLSILKNLGFYWKRFPRNRKFFMERRDIVASRERFLRVISKVNYDDVVWIWADDTANGSIAAQIPRNSRFIFMHAATSSGLIPNALLIFDGSKATGEYHEMSNVVFKEWFEKQLLPKIEKNKIMVMDNISYQSIMIETIPSPQWKKEDVQNWLKLKNIKFALKMYKAELLELARLHHSGEAIEEMDNLATRHGHSVIIVPTNHGYFNPIEVIWTQIKNYIADQDRTFISNDIEKLIREKIEGITNDEWKKVVDQVKNKIKKQTELEEMLENRVEEMIMSLVTTTDAAEDERDFDDF